MVKLVAKFSFLKAVAMPPSRRSAKIDMKSADVMVAPSRVVAYHFKLDITIVARTRPAATTTTTKAFQSRRDTATTRTRARNQPAEMAKAAEMATAKTANKKKEAKNGTQKQCRFFFSYLIFVFDFRVRLPCLFCIYSHILYRTIAHIIPIHN